MSYCAHACLEGLFLLARQLRGIDTTPKLPGFRVGAKLGSGSFASVWEAEDLKTGRLSALKVVKKRDEQHEEYLANEVKTMQAMDHQNILGLIHHVDDGSRMCFILELCNGGDLFDRIDRKAGLPEKHCRMVFMQCLAALQHMHSRGVAHRDVKPENLLFTNAGSIEGNVLKLADFGFAAHFDLQKPQSLSGVVGSSEYAAPEVSFSDFYGPECDLWSAGIVLYEMCCGTSALASQPSLRFSSRRARSISAVAKDLISLLLEQAAYERINATDALEHGWCQPRRHCACMPAAALQKLAAACAHGCGFLSLLGCSPGH